MADRELRLGMRLLFSGGATTLDPETLARVRDALADEVESRLGRLAKTWKKGGGKPEDLHRLNEAALTLGAFVVGRFWDDIKTGKLHVVEGPTPHRRPSRLAGATAWCRQRGDRHLSENTLRIGAPTCKLCRERLLGEGKYHRAGPVPPPAPWNKWWTDELRSYRREKEQNEQEIREQIEREHQEQREAIDRQHQDELAELDQQLRNGGFGPHRPGIEIVVLNPPPAKPKRRRRRRRRKKKA